MSKLPPLSVLKIYFGMTRSSFKSVQCQSALACTSSRLNELFLSTKSWASLNAGDNSEKKV